MSLPATLSLFLHPLSHRSLLLGASLSTLRFIDHRLLGFLLFVSIFSPFSCFWSVCPTSFGLPLGLVHAVRVPLLFFGIGFRFSMVFLLSYSGSLASSCFPRIFWVSLLLWGCFCLRFQLWLHLFFPLLSSLFCMLRFGLLLAVFLSGFPHDEATVDCFRSSSAFFRLLQFWLSLPVFLPLFRLLCLPVLSGLHPGFSASCASSCSSILAHLLLSSVLRVLHWQSLGCPGAAFLAFLLVFFHKVFTACIVFLPCPLG